MLKGLIYGRLQSYKHTNSNAKDYVHFAILLAKRLIARGWNQETITKLMDEAHRLLDMKPQHLNNTKPIPQLQPLIFPSTLSPSGTPTTDNPRHLWKNFWSRIESSLWLPYALETCKNIYHQQNCMMWKEITQATILHQTAGTTNTPHFFLKRKTAPSNSAVFLFKKTIYFVFGLSYANPLPLWEMTLPHKDLINFLIRVIRLKIQRLWLGICGKCALASLHGR
jgi:hypothetical protein